MGVIFPGSHKGLEVFCVCNVCGRIVCCFFNDNVDFVIDEQ